MAGIEDKMKRKTVICVYHVYNDIWTTAIRKILGYQAKSGTQLNKHTVVALKLYHCWNKDVFSLFTRRGEWYNAK